MDDYFVTLSRPNDQSFFYRIQGDGDGIRSLEVIPVLISNRQVNRAKGRDFMETVDR